MAHPTPRLLRLVKWVGILSDGEAEACVRDYREGRVYSGEAVNHFGGTRRLIERAVKFRTVMRDWNLVG